jgi:hypothetical protein
MRIAKWSRIFKIWFHRCFHFAFWFSLSDNVCHSPSVPEISDEVPENFEATEFLFVFANGASAFAQGSGGQDSETGRGLPTLPFRSYARQAADPADAEKLQGVRFAWPPARSLDRAEFYSCSMNRTSPRRPKAGF